MTIRGFKDIARSYDTYGREWTQAWRKVPAIATTGGVWADLSLAPGSPKPQYYVGAELAATQLKGIEINTAPDPDVTSSPGMWTGGNVSPAAKHLNSVMINSVTAAAVGTYILCDYLMFYSLIDMDSTDTQVFDNTITLPRYTDGVGVRAFLVATNPFVGGASFSVNYTDANGNTYDTDPIITPTTTNIGTVMNSTGALSQYSSAFLPLGRDGTGVVRANNITFFGPNGGLAALALVKPIATLAINEITAPSEFEFVRGPTILPRIYDDAFLSFLAMPTGSLAASPIFGTINTFWR